MDKNFRKPIEELCNLPHHNKEYKEYFNKTQSRGKFLSYNVAYRLERPWGSITRAAQGVIWDFMKEKLLFVRTPTCPASQPLVAVGFMVYSHPDYTY